MSDVDKLHPVWVFTAPVEKERIVHIGLWIKKTCGAREKGSYPHKFVLPLLLLPELIDREIYLIKSERKDFDYAFYL